MEIQLECKAAPVPDAEVIAHPVKLKNYDDLRAENVFVPRVLVLVLVPETVSDWLEQSEESLVMRRCGYWVSLRGLPSSENATGHTIRVPRSQVLTPSSLRDIMDRIGRGELP